MAAIRTARDPLADRAVRRNLVRFLYYKSKCSNCQSATASLRAQPPLPFRFTVIKQSPAPSGLSKSGNQLQKVDNRPKAMNPMLLPAPMVSFYFRYTFDFPTTLNLRSSFQNLYLWLQEQFSPATEQPSNHQNQNRVKIDAT